MVENFLKLGGRLFALFRGQVRFCAHVDVVEIGELGNELHLPEFDGRRCGSQIIQSLSRLLLVKGKLRPNRRQPSGIFASPTATGLHHPPQVTEQFRVDSHLSSIHTPRAVVQSLRPEHISLPL